MAPFSTRKPAPAWPPFKDTYRKLADGDDDIQLMLKPDVDTATSQQSAWLPTPTPRHTTFSTSRHKWWDGWRGGAKIAFAGAISVMLINIILIIAMSAGFEHMDGMAMIYIGSCSTSDRINAGIHLIVNILSTGLLAASSYCMQILSAPSRSDIDKAHAQGTWLDIGVSSLRNLRILSKKRIVLWWLLAFSSVPLHLFYNSVFFTAIATNDYSVLYATEDFTRGGAYDTQRFQDSTQLNITGLQANISKLERLDNQACIYEYAMDFVTDRKDVIAVIRGNSSTASSSLQKVTPNVIVPGTFNTSINTFAWICNDPSALARTNLSSDQPCSKVADALEPIANQGWRSSGYDIEYCLSETIVPDCHVHFAPQIMAPVLFFNIIKAAIIAYVAFFYKDMPIVTLGDAIESFTLNPDSTTQGMCLATHDLIEKHWTRGYTAQPLRYDGSRQLWLSAASWKQWTAFSLIFGSAAVAVWVCIGLGTESSQGGTLASAWSLGMGKVRTQNLITGLQATSLGANAVFISALVANSPQAIFSFIYLIYNNVFTTMVLSNEWDRFSIKFGAGRILRVSEPRGEQRSTYFLQIPYRYAIVMLSTSGLLHWLVSQSVFLANIAVIPLDGVRPKLDEITTCAYSVKAMLFIVVIQVWMMVWLFGNGFRRFSGGMPFVGSNSAAISAACHPEYALKCEREAMVLKPLRWGVTDYGNKKSPGISLADFDQPMSPSSTDWGSRRASTFADRESGYDDDYDERLFNMQVGHCTFTDGRIAKPVRGRFYA